MAGGLAPDHHFTQALGVMSEVLKRKPAKGSTGQEPCPICGGKVLWHYGGPRALRMRCSTENCLQLLS